MKILLIDNETINLNRLKVLLHNFEIETINFNQISFTKIDEFDLIILSGGSHHSVIGNEDIYKDELALIQNTQIPIIGICLGFQLICYAFGAHIERLDNKVHRLIEINLKKENNIFKNIPNLRVYE